MSKIVTYYNRNICAWYVLSRVNWKDATPVERKQWLGKYVDGTYTRMTGYFAPSHDSIFHHYSRRHWSGRTRVVRRYS